MSSYIDSISPILYGRYGSGSRHGGRHHITHYGSIGHHPAHSHHPLHAHHRRRHNGRNSAPQYWDYPNPTSRANLMKTQYGGRRIRGRGNNVLPIPPRYQTWSPYSLGNNYIGGYTKSLNTFIGGRKRRSRRGGNISQTRAYLAY